MGSAMMGEGEGEGENRALRAAQAAIANPLLDDVSMKGARGVLINITGGYDMTLFEVDEAANEVRREVDVDAHIILGSTFDEKMNGKIRVSVVAAGLQQQPARAAQPVRELQAGLTSAIFNTPSPAAELGIVAQPVQQPAPQPAPQPAYPPHGMTAPTQKTMIFPPSAQAPVPPSELRPPAPVIRPRPAPAPEPVMEADEDDADIFAPIPQAAPAPAAEAPRDRSFASLFGWSKRAPEEQPVARPTQADDSFDDELEIPAFLRRSGNA